MLETTTDPIKHMVYQALPGPSWYILWDSDIPGFGLQVETSGQNDALSKGGSYG